MPLSHSHFVPDYVLRYLVAWAALLMAGISVGWALERVTAPAVRIAIGITFVGMAIAGMLANARSFAADPAVLAAHQPHPPGLVALREYVTRHARPEDVVLSSNELSFTWAALTGRKTMVTRRAQNDAFVDMDVRNRDAALILYGNDHEARRRLLGAYRVSWVFWSAEWASTEYLFDSRGALWGVEDPLLYFQNDEYDEQLWRAGVQYFHANTWVDPRLRGEEYSRFDLTIVSPENSQGRERPWTPALDLLLEEAWSYQRAGRKIAALYRVKG